MPEFLDMLPNDDVAWGCFKVVGVDDRGNTVSRRDKFIFVKYVPAEGMYKRNILFIFLECNYSKLFVTTSQFV